MGTTLSELSDAMCEFIRGQRMFFVATSPRADSGHVNVSPKGLDTFRILGPRLVGYADYTGSGVETIAHIRENGRMTVMFCSFEGKPNILRIYGKGRAVEPGDAEFAKLLPQFTSAPPSPPPFRAIVLMEIMRAMDSCGFGVPLYEYVGERDQLEGWCRKKTPEEIAAYQARKNSVSMDGLKGLEGVKGR
jgi:hypothetical protein